MFVSGARSQSYVYTPTNTAGAWVTTVVPDVLLWYNMNGTYVAGPVTNLADEVAALANWEPYIDVVGDSVFLIGANTFADDGTFTNQQYVVTFQPVAGGKPVNASEFFADNGTPFTQEIDLSRENGNPQRVAGDRRTGATSFASMAETSAGQLTPFESNTRWTSNSAEFTGINRYCTEQIFSLNPATLAQTPLAEAWDYVYGPMSATALGTGNQAPQLSRTGGRPIALDNGNFAMVIADGTGFLTPSGRSPVFTIVTPTGEIIAGPTLVTTGEIWDNVAAFAGGFAVRDGSFIAFYDDLGNLISTNNVNAASGLSFDTGRGDGTRIASDIRSHYVYLAGETPVSSPNNPVSLAIFDARTGQCVATNTVSDTDPTVAAIDRVNVAVNALDQFCVVYDLIADPSVWTFDQIAARTGQFDGSNITFSTPSFYPFISSELDATNVLGYETENPSVVMTTKCICIAGKGTVNSTNNPSGGPDTAPQTTLYTVINIPISVPPLAAAAGLTRVVPDVLLWYNMNGTYEAGPVTNLTDQVADMANWEPYIDVMGDSVFLIGANTFADDGTFTNQQYVVTFQPVAGGKPVTASDFFSDNGTAFTQEIDLSRENGNPQRVAGDRRTGATNFASMAETSAGQLTPFESNTRWTSNSAEFTGINRYCTEQIFSLNPASLVQTPLVQAWDYVYGPMSATALGTGNQAPQLSRTGGRPVALDNGNFAMVIADATGFLTPSGRSPVFTIVTPTGEIIAGPTLVTTGEIWDNVAAFAGGFAVRDGSFIAFYDDLGNLISTNNVNTASGLSFDTGRGDGTRIASDIRSHYVYLAGETPISSPNNPVSIAIFDPTTGACVATNTVSDINPANATIDRVNLAVDALDHFCVAYDMNPNPAIWVNDQIVARIGHFDGTNVTYATSSFFAFINAENNPNNVQGFLSENPSVAMTTSYICMAGKGTLNSTNNPAGGPDTTAQTTLYTVLRNPYAVALPPTLSISETASNSVVVSWTGGGTLQSASALNGTWTNLTNGSPATLTIGPGDMFFRVASP